jgi:Tfp pilus assembly protein PilF
MKSLKINMAAVIFTIIFGLTTVSFAQVEDMFGEEEEEVQCVPENLMTSYDSVTYSNPDQPIALVYNFGYEYYKNKSYKEALPYLWRVFVNDSTKYARNAVRYIARMYFDQGIVDSTLIICYRGLEKFPNIITLHYYAAILQNKLGRSECAIPHYEALVADNENDYAKNPGDEQLKANYSDNLKTLAFLYYKTDNEKSIELQQKVTELNPTDPEAANTLAQYSDYFYGKGAGLAAYKQAYDNDPENLDLALKYAEAAAQTDTSERALEPLAKVIAKAPSKKAYTLRAGVYENLAQFSNAIDDYKQALNFSDKDADTMLKIAEDYKLVSNFGNATYWVGRALGARPGYGAAYIKMGEIYEAGASYCMKQHNSELKFEDKLVYQKALDEYEKAQNDPAFRAKAKTKQSYVQPLTPTKEDNFMNQGKKIDSDCYSWIK